MDIRADVISAFRTYYPEFSDASTWPDADVRRHLEDGVFETGGRWGAYEEEPRLSLRARGLFAYAAHSLVIARQRRKAVEAGGTPGAPSPVQSKDVGDESVSYAVQAPEGDANAIAQGALTTTVYGQEFLRLRRIAGAGAATTGSVKL